LNLEQVYKTGTEVPHDYQQAMSWNRKAAEQGDAHAQRDLGWMYANGSGVTQDYQQAVVWYRKAAEQGNADAQFDLGVMYGMGHGVTQNYVEAHKWFNIAGTGGDAEAIKQREAVERLMKPKQIAEAQHRASAWMAKHH
jgi:TPR repeat protein